MVTYVRNTVDITNFHSPFPFCSSYTVSDVEAIDIPFYNSLKYVLENDPEPLDLTFTVLEETFGEVTEYELKPGGSFIPVVPDNKHEYVELMVQWRLSNGIGPQMENLVKGLREMIPWQYLSSFDAQELEWVIAGTPEINLDDWKNNTIYWGGKVLLILMEVLLL
jgi:hypothetical protein